MKFVRGALAAMAVSAVMVGCGGSPAQPQTQSNSNVGTPTGNNGGNNNGGGNAGGGSNNASNVWDLATLGVPKFATSDYIELDAIEQISKFRSSEGHSYTDDFESCRTMKHYFRWRLSEGATAGNIKITAPAAGTISRMDAEQSFGTQVHLTPSAYPQFVVIIFHVNPVGIAVGSTVTSGQQIGTHIGNQTMSDIAVRASTPAGGALVSWFDAMSDAVFARYQLRGVSSRSAASITKAERDADPLTCSGEAYLTRGSIDSWLRLQ